MPFTTLPKKDEQFVLFPLICRTSLQFLVTAKGGKAKGGKAKGVKAKGGKAKGVKAKGGKAKGVKAKGGKAKGVKAKGGKAKGGKAKGGKAKGGKAKGVNAKGGKARCLLSLRSLISFKMLFYIAIPHVFNAIGIHELGFKKKYVGNKHLFGIILESCH